MDHEPIPVSNENTASYPPALSQAFAHISSETGVPGGRVDFGTVTKALIDHNPGDIIMTVHPDTKKPGTDQQEEPEAVRKEFLRGERYEDLTMFFGAAEGIKRKYQVVIDRFHNPHKLEVKPEDEFHDFVIMAEEMADGRYRVAIFDYPAKHWPVTVNGVMTHYLRLRMAAVIGKKGDGEVLFDSMGKDYEVGLLPHSDPNLESDFYAAPSRLLFRDVQRGISLHDNEEMPLSFPDFWTAYEYLNKEVLKKLQEEFPAFEDISAFLDNNRGPTTEFVMQHPRFAKLFGQILEEMYTENIPIKEAEEHVRRMIPNLDELNTAVFEKSKV